MYMNVLDSLDDLIHRESNLILAYEYQQEILGAIEILRLAGLFMDLVEAYNNREIGEYMLEYTTEETMEQAYEFYKDYSVSIDREIFKRGVGIYVRDLGEVYYPQPMQDAMRKYRVDVERYADHLFEKSIFSREKTIIDLLENLNQAAIAKIETDPVFLLARACEDLSGKIRQTYQYITALKNTQYRLYVRGLREMEPDRDFYADANGSMRITYGQISDYRPRDAIHYGSHTMLDGIIEKSFLPMDDYKVPERLAELYNKRDFGPYTVNGKVPVCFIASNHTSGGNSGSPVLNADGHLIGINFDRNWEGTMSDYVYDVDQCRNIAVDIRYVLFIIDRYAGAGHLIDEMKIITGEP